MSAKYLIPILILLTVLFWVLELVVPAQVALFVLLHNISFILLLLYSSIRLGMYLHMLIEWEDVEYGDLQRERFELTLPDDITIHGEILTTEKMNHSSPVVLACHGWTGRMAMLNIYTHPLLAQGYKIVRYNHRGHGRKPYKSGGNKAEIEKTFMDVKQLVDFIESRPDLNHERLGAMGFSFGAHIVLTEGYRDPRLKIVIACSASDDWKAMQKAWPFYIRFIFRLSGMKMFPPDELNKKLSPKYYLNQKMDKVVCLVHAKNDHFVSINGFFNNKKQLNLPNENTLVFETGDHGLFNKYTIVVSQIIRWFNDNLS